MRTPICDLLGSDHPIVGFTPSEHVAAAISRAGGLGVLDWMDLNTGGRPYGVDVVMPARVPAEGPSGTWGSSSRPGTGISSSGRCSSSACRRCRTTRRAARA
jgi:hypothetical protein